MWGGLSLTTTSVQHPLGWCDGCHRTMAPVRSPHTRPTEDAISHVLHSSLTHIDNNNGNYIRLLFIDYSSAFNTIVPIKLAFKLTDLGLHSSLCDWIQDFFTGRPQLVKVGQFTSTSNSITLNVGAPQGCVMSPLLYSLYTHTTACPLTAPHLSSNLLMTLWFWASFTTRMRPHTWMR